MEGVIVPCFGTLYLEQDEEVRGKQVLDGA
jgi:hypothetical protein